MNSNHLTTEISQESLHPKFSSAISQRCEELIIELEQDVKKLDNEFSFSWDQELSLIRASKCIKQAVEKILQEKNIIKGQSDIQKSPESSISLFENSSKDLEDREKALKNERIRLDSYRKDLSDERDRINQEKIHIEESFERITEEKNNLNLQMKKLDEKYSEIKQALLEFEKPQENSLVSVKTGETTISKLYADVKKRAERPS